MPLQKISEVDTDCCNTIQSNDAKVKEVYIESTDEKIRTVKDIIVDEQGVFRKRRPRNIPLFHSSDKK
jgi:hypothetical protein